MDQTANTNVEFYCHRCNRYFHTDAQPPDVRCSACNDDFVEMMPSSSSSAQRRESRRFGFSFPSQLPRRSRVVPRVNPVSRSNIAVQVSSGEGGTNILTGVLPLGDLAESGLFPDTLVATIYQFFDLLPSGPPPATSEDIRRLSDYEITQEDIDNQRECPICMESFHLSEQTKCLPCKHTFHERCIMQWLELRGTCPVCRRTLQGADTSRQEFFLPLDGHVRNLSGATASAVSEGGLAATRQQPSDTRSAIFSAVAADPSDDLNPFRSFLQQPAAPTNRQHSSSSESSFLTSSASSLNIPPPRNGAVVRATVSARIQPVMGSGSSSGQPAARNANRSRIGLIRTSAPASATVRSGPQPNAASRGGAASSSSSSTFQNWQSRLGSAARIARLFTRPFFSEEPPSSDSDMSFEVLSSHQEQQQQQDAAGGNDAERSAPLQDDLD